MVSCSATTVRGLLWYLVVLHSQGSVVVSCSATTIRGLLWYLVVLPQSGECCGIL